MASDFFATVLKTGRQWSNAFIILKENDYQSRILCQMRVESIPLEHVYSLANILRKRMHATQIGNKERYKRTPDPGNRKRNTAEKQRGPPGGLDGNGVSRVKVVGADLKAPEELLQENKLIK